MKRPILLLFGIIFSIVLLSVIYPADPSQMGLIDRIMKTERKPVPTPEQKEVFYSVGNIVKVDKDGKALVWSPDESKLYYTKSVKGDNDSYDELWISNLNGKNNKIDSKTKFYDIREAKWSPDGKFLCFISGSSDGKSSLFLYNINSGTIKDITPKKIHDIGVTSYDWDSESSEIIMTTDIVDPGIEIYSLMTKKTRKLDIKLKACNQAAFYAGGSIIFNDEDEKEKYKIYSADISGKNASFITEGRNFIVSPDKKKLALISDEDGQDGLWIYYTDTKEKTTITDSPEYKAYWTASSRNLVYSLEEDCINGSAYNENIYYVEQDTKVTSIKNVLYPIFVLSPKGTRIAMTCPEYVGAKEEYNGVFIGVIVK